MILLLLFLPGSVHVRGGVNPWLMSPVGAREASWAGRCSRRSRGGEARRGSRAAVPPAPSPRSPARASRRPTRARHVPDEKLALRRLHSLAHGVRGGAAREEIRINGLIARAAQLGHFVLD